MNRSDRGREAAALLGLLGFARPESLLGDSGLAHYYEQGVVVMSPASLCLYQVLPPAYARMQ